MKIYGENEKNFDFIEIGWDITTKCNFECDYCYARERYGEEWQKDFLTTEFINKLTTLLKQSNKKFIINVLGGEPTISNKYDEVISNLAQVENIEINIYTNFSKPIDFWMRESTRNINKIVISFHPNEIKDYQKFFDKIKKLSSFNVCQIELRLMLHSDIKKCEELENKYLNNLIELNNLFNVEVYLDYIALFNTKIEILKHLKSFEKLYNNFSKTLYVNDQPILEKDIYIKDINVFGAICKQHKYVLLKDGTFLDPCSGKSFDLVKAFFHFRKPNVITCDRNFCPCYDFLENYKELI